MHELSDLMNIVADAIIALGALWTIAVWSVKLNVVYKEHRPNGGSSMKDRVAKLEDMNVKQTESLERIETRLDRAGIAK